MNSKKNDGSIGRISELVRLAADLFSNSDNEEVSKKLHTPSDKLGGQSPLEKAKKSPEGFASAWKFLKSLGVK